MIKCIRVSAYSFLKNLCTLIFVLKNYERCVTHLLKLNFQSNKYNFINLSSNDCFMMSLCFTQVHSFPEPTCMHCVVRVALIMYKV